MKWQWFKNLFKTKRRKFQENNFDRFMRKVKVNKNGCWNWLGCKNEGGYGKFWSREYGMAYAHRTAWRMFVGDPSGGIVCHKCDNRICVNPDHLYLGDHFTNSRDRYTKHLLAQKDSRNGSSPPSAS